MTSKTTVLDVNVPGLDKLFIGGEWVDPATDGIFDVVSPSTEEVVAKVSDPSTMDADKAVNAARMAFDLGPWPKMSMDERVAICTRLCDEMERRLDDMNRAWAWESGAPLTHGEMINSGAGVMVWRYALQIAPKLQFEERRQTPTGEVLIQRQPTGSVLAILTYNGPVVLMGMKVIPALLAGCPVIIKPAPESQLTTRIVADCVEAAGFPPGVVSVLAAGQEVSQHLVSHPGVDLVALTGGTAIAADVLHRIADRIGRAALELGGKSAAIITDDVDLDEVLATLVPGSAGFCGQVCVSLSRILASRERYDEVVQAVASAYAAMKIGDPFDRETVLGPLAVKRARERTEHNVALAKEEGATVATGGRRPPQFERGWYYEPTLLSGVKNSMAVAQQEIFGPVVCAIPYEDIDDAINIANDSTLGLAASVYCRDEAVALDIANRVRSGSVAINLAGICLTEPFGGIKQSGYGRECGPEGIFEFTEIKQILLSGSYLES